MITPTELRALLSYNPHTGVFTWRDNAYHRVAGKVAGNLNSRGYVCIKLQGHLYYAHRLVYLYHGGYYPEYEIDHINNIKDDNRLCNLREVTHAENQLNRIDTKRNGVQKYYRDETGRLHRIKTTKDP